MEALFPFLTPFTMVCAFAIAAFAGFVKGVVGFAQPLVMISGLTLFLSPELALAGLIVPTLIGNTIQSLRQGAAAALETVRLFRLFLLVGGVTLVISAQLVRVVPERGMLLLIGVPVVLFVLLQLSGVRLRVRPDNRVAEALVGAFAGVTGGFMGVWGPPTVTYLTARDTPKADQMRVQGVIYGAGSVALLGAHVGSGVLRAETLPFSVVMVVPALLGMWVGGQVSDRIDQTAFRRATLIVLLLAGANLIRRALV
ncbi:sulfite exporter TauE/SafE family protein [Sulfitobacter sp. JB4-11]|uniref:sulfite exporter TauE/SafE family protein n=1 Tax=Sulfitobacter rhodophyticola TaxID=3238304 RepID=UPI0035195392